ncbi:MAG: sugar ABC transporter ATP-binding protein [Christensenellaceae bacterium]|nr:sugar ABC transporter ATP-binding protein [Christensenellaceae bacterium]
MQKDIVVMKNICKTFPGVKALDNATLQLREGEVMALLGENGAGKSTLVKILSGVYTKDSGTIEVFGKNIPVMNQKTAAENGIAIIHQELNMCPHLSITGNIFLGRELTKNGIIDDKTMQEKTREVLNRLGLKLDPATVTGTLPVAQQQLVEICRALSINAKILIMDEPTSALTNKEIEQLFDIIRQLKSEGCGIIYISHRLEELKLITDRVTIMRDGKFVTSGDYSSFTMDEIISHMVGREIKEKYPHEYANIGNTVLEVKGLNAGRLVRDVSFNVKEGEIVGMAGLLGAGRTETLRAIFGADEKESGEILVDGKSCSINDVKDAIEAGIVLVPDDRKKRGLCLNLSVRENIALPNLDELSNAGVLDNKKEEAMAEKAVKAMNIRLPGIEAGSANLSGGNQQKVVISKWLMRDSRVIMLDEPTRGIDVSAKVEIYQIMNRLKAQGIGCLFVSSELPEILGISDRIIVMCDGKITGELSREEATQEKILTLATMFENKTN